MSMHIDCYIDNMIICIYIYAYMNIYMLSIYKSHLQTHVIRTHRFVTPLTCVDSDLPKTGILGLFAPKINAAVRSVWFMQIFGHNYASSASPFGLPCFVNSTFGVQQIIKISRWLRIKRKWDPILQFVLLQGNACIGLKPWISKNVNLENCCEETYHTIVPVGPTRGIHLQELARIQELRYFQCQHCLRDGSCSL